MLLFERADFLNTLLPWSVSFKFIFINLLCFRGRYRRTRLQKVILGARITELRKAKDWSQSELAKKIGESCTQKSRYEIEGVQPPANIINKLADALGTSIDFLISGDKDEKVKASFKDAELLQQFKAVEQFSDDDKTVVKKLIDVFIVKK